jgi:molecular chaperone GrpE
MADNDNKAKSEAEILQSLVEAIQQDASDAEEAPEPSELEKLRAENADLRDKLLRAVAEGENIRRRAERELQETNKFAITVFARDLVSVFENLHRATSSISEEMKQESNIVANIAMGVQMTLKEMEQVFAKQKIARLDPIGEMFNHQFHQAMNKVEDASKPEGTIINVMQACYTIHDRLLQPALVTVSTVPLDANPKGDISHVDTSA